MSSGNTPPPQINQRHFSEAAEAALTPVVACQREAGPAERRPHRRQGTQRRHSQLPRPRAENVF